MLKFLSLVFSEDSLVICFDKLGKFFKKISFYRLLVFYYYFAYLYVLLGVFFVLQYAKITPKLFVKQLLVFPSLNTMFWYKLFSEVIYEDFFVEDFFVEDFNELFDLLWFNSSSEILFDFFLYYLYFFSI